MQDLYCNGDNYFLSIKQIWINVVLFILMVNIEFQQI